jgi:hypothetical protein
MLGFLGPELCQRIRLTGNFPQLSGSFESSVTGMYYVGLLTPAMFGPLMRFVCGTQFAARRVSRASGPAGRWPRPGKEPGPCRSQWCTRKN